MKDQQSVEDRREEIYAMHLRGLSESEIAEAVGVSQSTVSRALDAMRKTNQEWFRQHWDQGSYLGGLVKEQRDRLMELVREAWTLYRSIGEKDAGKKIQILGLVKSTIKDLGQRLGLQLPSLSNPENYDSLDQAEDTAEETTETYADQNSPDYS